jgi:hypothetical protein
MMMRRHLSAAVLITMVLVAGCGRDDVDRTGSATSASPTPERSGPSPSPLETAPPHEANALRLEVWFSEGGRLRVSHKEHAPTQGVGAAAVRALLQGPNGSLSTAIPSGTQLLGLRIEEGTAVVDLTEQFASGGGSLSMQMRVAQVVFTLTQFETVDRVAFELEGTPLSVLGGEGVLLDPPPTREDFEDLLPAITVERPASDEPVSSPLRVTGTANVFEATVQLRLVTRNGSVLAETFTTATCGTGCRGTYKESLRFSVSERTSAFVEVYEASAEDGREVNLVRVPVTLLP